jgi:hypothetical protein
MEEKEQISADDLKLLIEENQYLRYCLKVMNGISALEEDDNIDYLELYNRIALNKKLELPESTIESAVFYFSFLSCGIDNFGKEFLDKFRENDSNWNILCYAIKSFIDFMSENSKNNEENSAKNENI